MAFPKEGSAFPPVEWTYWQNKYDEYAAWYSGDSDELLSYYASKVLTPYTDQSVFWARLEGEERENAVHMPAAGDIASISANLLFSEAPRFEYEKNTKSGERITDFFTENGFDNILLEGAELAAALTGVFVKLDLDSRISKLPIVSIITPLHAYPTFLRGRLWEVLFYRVVKEERGGTVVYRLFENRSKTEDGRGVDIQYKLYKGTQDKVGSIIDFNRLEETANLSLEDIRYNNIDGLGVVYVPNMRPNRLEPGSTLGINDYSGCIPLMDSLDLCWTSWVRDIELGMGQIFVDEELLSRETQNIFGTEQTFLNSFSKFQKCFLKLNFSNYKMGGENIKPIESLQFEMRVEEHLKSCEYFFKQIVSQCGYSPGTFGIDSEGRAESGTALRIRERKSFLTREKKSRYWLPAIKSILLQMQQLDNAINTTFNEISDINIELEDSIIVDQSEQSVTLRNLEQARAISTYLKVKMQHPDWNDESINEEVKRIEDAEGIEKASDLFNNPA